MFFETICTSNFIKRDVVSLSWIIRNVMQTGETCNFAIKNAIIKEAFVTNTYTHKIFAILICQFCQHHFCLDTQNVIMVAACLDGKMNTFVFFTVRINSVIRGVAFMMFESWTIQHVRYTRMTNKTSLSDHIKDSIKNVQAFSSIMPDTMQFNGQACFQCWYSNLNFIHKRILI